MTANEGPAQRPGELRLACTLHARLSAVSPALDALERMLVAAGAGAEERGEVRLMAEETLMNIVAYAFDTDAPGSIDVRCVCTPDQVCLEFRDSGRPFNPLAVLPPDLNPPPEERTVGGLGIHLIRSLADAVAYDHLQGCNVLQLTRQRRSGGMGGGCTAPTG